MSKHEADSFEVSILGESRFENPILAAGHRSNARERSDRILVDDHAGGDDRGSGPEPFFELAGARSKIFFEPSAIRAGIVTCGGLCPGLNDVIRGLVNVLWHRYGVRRIDGYPYGYEGLAPSVGHEVRELTPERVKDIHKEGGTILGTSRGPQDPAEMASFLLDRGVGILFVIGGDGTMKGAEAIAAAARERSGGLAVVGVPKTIDNDIPWIDESFGFETAFGVGMQAIRGADAEANGARNGIGLVKLMGRHSGFIAAYAALANNDANYVLVPEVAFALEGEDGLFASLEARLEARGHAVIVVAEGAGQDLLELEDEERDASGNVKLGDIGPFLQRKIGDHLKGRGVDHTIKYIDPSYMVRSVPASANDSLYCFRLAEAAAHAAMAGRTEIVVARYHGRMVHIPMALVTEGRKRIDPQGELWQSVLDATGQPVWPAA